MSTRGLWGFKYNNQYKVTYNHNDSYPTCLGYELLEQIKSYSVEHMKKRFDKIIMVDEDDIVPDTIYNNLLLHKYITPSKSKDYYFVLREWQGQLKPYMEYEYPYMCDSIELFADKRNIIIEYSYIIDLDDEVFISYKSIRNKPVGISLDAIKLVSFDDYIDILKGCWGAAEVD